MSTAFAALVAGSLKSERFTFVDVGCSGGLDSIWRVFGEKFRAVGFDASAEECRRLSSAEDHPEVKYIAAFAGLPADHPVARQAAGRPWFYRDLTPRTSYGRFMQVQKDKLKTASLGEKLRHNAWGMTELADPTKPIVVPEFLRDHGWLDVDLLKIDIDSIDYQVLNSFDCYLDSLGLLAARLEVNFFGGVGESEHVFHNTDRFMRARGFELMGLEIRTYSMAALPAPFAITAPAQTTTGRPMQADALYARDPCGPDWAEIGNAMSPEKLAKLAAILSIWNLPDAAAEILVNFQNKLECVLDVEIGLELLTGQTQTGRDYALPYRDYIAEFESGSLNFFPPPWLPWAPPTLRQRMSAAIRAFMNPHPSSK